MERRALFIRTSVNQGIDLAAIESWEAIADQQMVLTIKLTMHSGNQITITGDAADALEMMLKDASADIFFDLSPEQKQQRDHNRPPRTIR